MNYDVIGDIHGQADKLEHLLSAMGYRHQHGAYRLQGRQAIFVGDLIDRGPDQLRSVSIARQMVEAGSALAVMGNHEFNAIAWHTDDPHQRGAHLRTRDGELGKKNRAQHAAFLAATEHDPDLHGDVIGWFKTLPLWLDLPGIRVVHACWHDGYMQMLKPHLTPGHQLTESTLVAASRPGSLEFQTVECLTKGLEASLPPGISYTDKDGHVRHQQRVAWWNRHDSTFRALAVADEDVRTTLPDIPISPDIRPAYDNAKPVFFGHYWMTGVPRLQSPMMACVDYSAAKGGPLVAYRWSGEPELDSRNFFQVA
jgi:hypothetical protein